MASFLKASKSYEIFRGVSLEGPQYHMYGCEKVKSLSRVRLFVTPSTVAHQAPPSMGFSRQEYWSGLPFPSPGDLPDPGIELRSPTLQADALTSEPPGKPQEITIPAPKMFREELKWRLVQCLSQCINAKYSIKEEDSGDNHPVYEGQENRRERGKEILIQYRDDILKDQVV